MTTLHAFGKLIPADKPAECYPALRQRQQRPLDSRVDTARRELWRAFQRGALSEDEFARTLERMECQ
jgi:hypothetical protein